MSKDQKSMDEVLASIRKIIRTDPTVTPPDISAAPGGMVVDETAREVLDKLRRGPGDEEREPGKPLSTSDDPDESAQAVLDHLRRQAKSESTGEPERARAAEPEPEPELEPTPEEPPAVATDAADVPDLEETDEADEVDEAGGPLELGADAGGRVMAPKSAPAAEPELPQPASGAAPDRRDDRDTPVMVDEAALEAMIRRVVRDELMGEMGRRVTQNVVRLIREEVARSQIEKK